MNFVIAPKSTEIQANWYDAKLYCFSLNIDGKVGWRLPTKDELNQIYRVKNDFGRTYYWSYTEYDVSDVWLQNFGNGNQLSGNKSYGSLYVRAVRDIK